VSQARPAFQPSGGQHLSPASGFHPFEKAMLFFTLQFFGLIGSFHADTLLSGKTGQSHPCPYKVVLYPMALLYVKGLSTKTKDLPSPFRGLSPAVPKGKMPQKRRLGTAKPKERGIFSIYFAYPIY
jgi:hypothetical protein